MNEPTPEAPPPGLAQQLANGIAGMRCEIGGVRELATSAGRLHPAAARKMTDILQRLMVLTSHVTTMETIVSAKKAIGELASAPRQAQHEELELVALSADTRERMAASLRRVGDDTLDGEEDES